MNRSDEMTSHGLLDLFVQIGIVDLEASIPWRDLPQETKLKWAGVACSFLGEFVDREMQVGHMLRESFIEARCGVLRLKTDAGKRKAEAATIGFIRRFENGGTVEG